MNSEIKNEETTEAKKEQHLLFQVTPLSKYLAMLLFIILPFIGGWIGYAYAPEKVVEIIKEVPQKTKVVEEVAIPEDDASLVVEQLMWASKVKIYEDNSMIVMPYINSASATVTDMTFPAGWTISFSEQTSPAQSKTIRFNDPNLPGKPDTDALGAYVSVSFTRAASCEETFIYENNPGFLNYSAELSSEELRIFSSEWVTNRTMGDVPLKEVCIENTNEYQDVLLMKLHPLTEENKLLLDTVVQSVKIDKKGLIN